MSPLGIITRTANTIGNATAGALEFADKSLGFVFKNGGTIVSSAGLGAVAGCTLSMGARIGFFQGTVQGVLYAWALRPMGTFIANHAGNKPDQFNDNARALLYLVGSVADFAIPILITAYCGKEMMTFVAEYSPVLGWVFLPAENAQFGLVGSVFLNTIPSAMCLTVSALTYVDPNKKTVYR